MDPVQVPYLCKLLNFPVPLTAAKLGEFCSHCRTKVFHCLVNPLCPGWRVEAIVVELVESMQSWRSPSSPQVDSLKPPFLTHRRGTQACGLFHYAGWHAIRIQSTHFCSRNEHLCNYFHLRLVEPLGFLSHLGQATFI